MIGKPEVASLTVRIGETPASLTYAFIALVEGYFGGDEYYAVLFECEIFFLVEQVFQAVSYAVFGCVGICVVGVCLLFHFCLHFFCRSFAVTFATTVMPGVLS